MWRYSDIQLHTESRNHVPCSAVTNGKHPVTQGQFAAGKILCQSDCDMLGHKGDLLIPARLRLLNYEFSSVYIGSTEFENFSNTEPATRLKLQYQPISSVFGLEDDLIHCLLIQNLSGTVLGYFECL